MAVAALLTLLALAGVAVGILLGQAHLFSGYVAAAGGGLLLGISLFWLTPEIASLSGWIAACAMTLAACLALSVADRMFLHAGHASNRVVLAPILVATATHSFLDGWSVRALINLRLAGIAAPIGLALHKIPEGVAIGWIARQGLRSPLKAAAAAIAVELFTMLGAYVEAPASRSGFETFGSWWISALLALISGSFLFFGVHAVAPNRRRLGVMLVFAATLVLVATIGLFKAANI
jgi:hypothetical protein